jgi:hypothetical protein
VELAKPTQIKSPPTGRSPKNWTELSTPPVALSLLLSPSCSNAETKKAGVAEHPEVFDHAGLLLNEPSRDAEMLFAKSSDIGII